MKKHLFTFLLIAVLPVSYAQEITLSTFATGIPNPVDITHAGDSRLFVVQQTGQIRVVNSDGSVMPAPFLDISSIVSSSGERGLLGLAFHPDYETNGYFYVNYTNTSGNTVIARYSVSESNPNVADASSVSILLTINQPFSNHNGGCIQFGPDGYLWISMGDGGSAGDPQNNSQNTNTLLGKMLRIDVDGGAPYGIPEDNPFSSGDGGEAEIWATGLRNAWKFSFDSLTNEVWIADVGQNQIEEINKEDYTEAGLNYGWRCYEGTNPYNTSGCAPISTFTFPFTQYSHGSGRCSITGGYVYRGSVYADIQGLYFFADYCSNEVGVVDSDGNISYLANASGNPATFGQDVTGELYVAGKNNGTIFKIHGSVLSTENAELSNLIKIYPNPASDKLFIDYTGGNLKVKEIELLDMTGKVVLKYYPKNESKVELDVKGFSPGVYIVKILDEKSLSKNVKIIIN